MKHGRSASTFIRTAPGTRRSGPHRFRTRRHRNRSCLDSGRSLTARSHSECHSAGYRCRAAGARCRESRFSESLRSCFPTAIRWLCRLETRGSGLCADCGNGRATHAEHSDTRPFGRRTAGACFSGVCKTVFIFAAHRMGELSNLSCRT